MKLISTKDYLLLIDEEANVCRGQFRFLNNTVELIHEGHNYPYKGVKIVAYYPLTKDAKELDLPLLPSFEEVESIFNKKANIPYFPADLKETCRHWFIEGYKEATKQFSLEDMKKAIDLAREYEFIMFGNGDTEHTHSEQEIINMVSTQQLPKEFIISDKFSTFEENIKYGEYKWRNLETST